MRLLAIVAALAALPASAASFSFSGAFGADDDLQLFTFSIGSSSTVTMTTLGYAGGTNAAAATILPGGFDPYLSLFDSTGALLAGIDDTFGLPNDPVSGLAHDSQLMLLLAPGTYTLALTQFDNLPAGANLANGFTRTGDPTFTGTLFGCSNGMFCDSPPANRTSAWAVDIVDVDSARTGMAPVPEPGSVFLLGIGLLLAGRGLRKRQSA